MHDARVDYVRLNRKLSELMEPKVGYISAVIIIFITIYLLQKSLFLERGRLPLNKKKNWGKCS